MAKISGFLAPVSHLSYFGLARLAKAGLSHTQILWGVAGVTMLVPLYCPVYMTVAQLVASRAPTKAHLSKANTAAELAANAGHGIGQSAS